MIRVCQTSSVIQRPSIAFNIMLYICINVSHRLRIRNQAISRFTFHETAHLNILPTGAIFIDTISIRHRRTYTLSHKHDTHSMLNQNRTAKSTPTSECRTRTRRFVRPRVCTRHGTCLHRCQALTR